MRSATRAALGRLALVLLGDLAGEAALRGRAAEMLTNAPAGLHNVFRLTPQVLSGAQPEGDAAYAWLAAQGIRTLVSVDGARPNLEAARRHGLRYVHLPIGYDGIPTNRFVQLAQLARTMPGPFYFHCHHGKHRGPAAAAAFCETAAGWSPALAEAWMRQAGTAADYAGLFRSVREFQPPPAALVAASTNALPEVSPPVGTAAVMVRLDAHLDHLQACQRAGWQAPPDHADLTPAHEALLLLEQLRELGRTPDTAARPAAYREFLARATDAAAELHGRLAAKATDPTAAATDREAAFKRVTAACTDCHRQHRN